MEQSSLLGRFVSYGENWVLWIQYMVNTWFMQLGLCQIHFCSWLCQLRLLNKDPAVWLDGDRSTPISFIGHALAWKWVGQTDNLPNSVPTLSVGKTNVAAFMPKALWSVQNVGEIDINNNQDCFYRFSQCPRSQGKYRSTTSVLGAWYLMGENLEVVWAGFSTLS
jgi:hypothetical protein